MSHAENSAFSYAAMDPLGPKVRSLMAEVYGDPARGAPGAPR
jgi:hypothetical protein